MSEAKDGPKRTAAGWLKSGMAEWKIDSTIFISVVFSWNIIEAQQSAYHWRSLDYNVRVGGPAAQLNPAPFEDFTLGGEVNALQYHNPRATFTTRGCIRKCPFCVVPKIEGDLVELESWEPRPLICDNNFLACSRGHFDKVIDRLKQSKIKGIDFNQGLDARLLTPYHAGRLAELNLKMVRFSWDFIGLEDDVMEAWEVLRDAGIPKSKITIFVLMGFNDTPEDAWYRLERIDKLGCMPFPMRYQPLDTLKRNSYIGPDWTGWLLNAYMRYWARRRFTKKIPFEEWLETYYERGQKEQQKAVNRLINI